MNKSLTRTITYTGIYTAIILLFVSCANIVAPSGGPRDTTPPRPVRSIPVNYSIQFNRNRIEILFDEFILIRDLKNQLLISPPLNEMPDIKVKGRSLVIELKEKLKENTTYTLFFGDAIIDLTEGNPLSAYEYVFSTGNIIDSMSISGKVVDAFTLKPEKDIFVMLYDQTNDSTPYKEKPYYLAKTSENGDYSINNLRNIPFKIFALKDVNNNFIYDQPIEKIAFADSLVVPHFKPHIKTDTAQNDSLQKDSLRTKTDIVKQLSLPDLRTFLEIDSTQRLLRAEFIKKGKLLFTFRYPVKNLKINTLNRIKDNKWKIEEWNTAKDTLIYWILNPEIDSLNLIINDNDQLIDTLNLRVKQKTLVVDTSTVQLKKKYAKLPPVIIPKIYAVSNLSQIFDFYRKISFTFPNPMLKFDSVAVLLIETNDSLITYAYHEDSVYRKFLIHKELKQGQEYKLILKEDLLTDIFGQNNDSLIFNFKTNTAEDIGNFNFNVTVKDSVHPYIIQLLNEKEELVEQRFIDKNVTLKFKHLTPGGYYIRAIIDVNRNQKWDTGKYLRKVQPESAVNYPTKITIRANWDLEESWVL